jgi:hypothetical protein
VLDPVAEQNQHAKKQRERIYNDNTYFTSTKPPTDAPAWTCRDEKYIYETDETDYVDYGG